MDYKDAWGELKQRLGKAEYELRLMWQKQQNGSHEQLRLGTKISGLMISLEYMHEMESPLENNQTQSEKNGIREIKDYLENSYTGARMSCFKQGSHYCIRPDGLLCARVY